MQNHILDSVHDCDVASLIDGSQVASTEPAIRKCLKACLGQLPIALKDSWPSALDFANLMGSWLQWLALWAHQAHIQQAEGTSRGADQVKLLLQAANTSS